MIILNRLAIAAALGFAGVTSAEAQTPPPPSAAPVSARADQGYQIAQLLNSEQLTRRQLPKLFQQMAAMFRSDPNVSAMEKEYPGISDYVIAAMKPPAVQKVISGLPELWTKLGVVYSGGMTKAELTAALNFYRSSTGTKMIAAMVDNMDYSGLIRDVSGDNYAGKIKSGTIDAMSRDASSKSLPGVMAPSDRVALMAFSRTSTFAKLFALQPKLSAIAASHANVADPAMSKQMEALTLAAIGEFMRAKEEGRSPRAPELIMATIS